MSLSRSLPSSFARAVRSHYEIRGFSHVVVGLLCEEIGRRSSDAGLRIADGCWLAIDRLESAFEPIDQTALPAILHPEPAAIMAMSFGYRLGRAFAHRPEDRQPSINNIAIAQSLDRCKRIFPEALVAIQNEVALACPDLDEIAPNVVSPARDWTTTEVLSYFVQQLPPTAFVENRNVLIVSHLHHYGRCAFFLSRAGLEPFIAPKEAVAYSGYDAQEAQPRFRSAWEYILNDFLALCKAVSTS